MTKIKRKSNINKNKKKINKSKKSHYIKDRAIIKFILEHSKKPIIDFSKIKIPSFIDISKNDFSENQKDNTNLFNSNDSSRKEKVDKKSGLIPPITFTFSIFNNQQNWAINLNSNEPKIKSFL